MTSKRFLLPILAIAGLGLPAWADGTEYCSGPGCGTNNQASFNTAITAGDYTYAGLLNFTSVNGVLSGDTYTDGLTGITFVDYASGNPSGVFTDTSGTLSSPVGDYTIQITIPDTYLAIMLDVNAPTGVCSGDCPEGQTSGFVGFINTGSPTAPWVVNISPLGAGQVTQILNFDAASPADMGDPSSTPEVGTLLLIGAGLIAMRWMRRWPRRRVRTSLPASAQFQQC